MSFNKNSVSTSNNKYAILAQQFNRKRQSSDPLPVPTRAAPAPPAHASVRDKSPRALAQSSSSGAPAPSTSNKETSSKKPVLVTTVQPLQVVKKSKPGSYAHAAARGVSPGSTITLRSRSKSPHPIWDPACPRIEEWYKVEKDNFVFTKNCLGSLFCAIYRVHNEYIPGDIIRTKYQNPQREKVNEWLSDLNESSLSPLDIIEISNHRGEIIEMYRLPKKETQPRTPSPKGKGKEHARQSDEQAALMADLTQAICESIGGASPKLDRVINDALGGDIWFDKFKKAQSTY